MTQTVKNSLKAALVLIVIAVVAVTALMLANAFFPKYQPKLDLAKVTQLQTVAAAGVEDQAALDGGYYRIFSSEAKTDEFDIVKFNKDYKGSNDNNKVLAVYSVEKGDNAGQFITETKTTGFGTQIQIILTSFDAAGKILKVNVIEFTNGDYYAGEYANLSAKLGGKDSIELSDVKSSGATDSSNGVLKNIDMSLKAVKAIIAAGGAK